MTERTELVVSFLSEGRIKVLVDYHWGAEMVPADFVCDGTSIPRLGYAWEPPHGLFLWAAVIHAYHYSYHIEMLADGSCSPITRAEADRRFYQRLRELGIRSSKAWAAWIAVRLVGGLAWRAE